ncbi:ATP-binding protein [Streptomyces sp. CNZ748]|uniref:ATP-binding protein n=1 Tax=Streptomyces sp. CNZ748 TaxID=2885160 RepID=UPI0027E1B6E3|nr:ATP-binding protein [Streptomyces sp. CNZ748]
MKSTNTRVEPPTDAPHLTIRLSSTARGARLARRLAGQQLAAWGVPYDSETSQAVGLVTAELAANAVTHGRTPGRDFRLTLLLLPEHGVVRVEVTDTRPGRRPRDPATEPAVPDAPSGRGLLLVAAYAERWGCEVRDAYTKTVWAEVALPPASVSRPLSRAAAEGYQAMADPSRRSTLVN